MNRAHIFMALLGLAFACPSIARADAIVVTKAMTASTIAEIFIDQGMIRVELEIGVGDLNGFRSIMPDELYERLGHDPVRLAERIPRFFAEDWVIRVDGGDPLVGRIMRLEPGHRIKRDEGTGPAAHRRRGCLCDFGEGVLSFACEYGTGRRRQ